MPPRHGKSTLASQYFPAWYSGRFPEKRIILTSYEADFAAQWGRKSRDVLEEFGPSLFGIRVRRDSSAADRWDLEGHQGGMVTAGIGGAITGRGADLLIIDDPVKDAEQALSPAYRKRAWDWYLSTAATRLEPGGSILIMQTRWNAEDLAGMIGRQAKETGELWDEVTLPAISEEGDQLGRAPGEALWPERFPLTELAKIKASYESVGKLYWWLTLYQQKDVSEASVEWPDSYFGDEIWFDDWPQLLAFRVLALDPSKGKDAKHGDYSAYALVGLDVHANYWVEADLDRRTVTQMVADGIRHLRSWKPISFAVEVNGFQELLGPEFIRQARATKTAIPLFGIHNYIAKVVRIRSLGPLLAQGRMRFRKTPGTKLLVQQLKQFPTGEHDDGPDALEMAVRSIKHLLGEEQAGPTPQLISG